MRDRQYEDVYYPRTPLPVDEIAGVLCVAPHPDDEVFGCGGLLAMLARRGCPTGILILSRGERAAGSASAALGATRVEESRRAARILGVQPPEFLDWPDRGMQYGEPLIQVLQEALAKFRPQYLLLPALSEPHPDHQAVALAGMAAAQRCEFPRTLLFYEVGAPFHPNVVVDISREAPIKWQAVQQFVSQLGIQAYEEHARALASVRAFGTPGCTAAEAFFRVEVSELRAAGAAAALPFWPVVRTRQSLANGPGQLPLVSILARGRDPAGLLGASASVVAQTYSNIEFVFVDAGRPQDMPLPQLPPTLPLRLVRPACEPALTRSRAANLALREAQGELALFLDDTDLLEPHHIERLVSALAAAPDAVAAYAGVRVQHADGSVGTADLPWHRERLLGADFLPLPAVLFRLDRVKAAAAEFDESLPQEDVWSFWRKIAALGSFVHCPGVSATHRWGAATDDAGEAVDWHAMELARLQASCENLKLDLERAFGALHAGDSQRLHLEDQLAAATHGNSALQAELDRIQGSRSWRMTQPLRSAGRWLRTLLS